MVQIKNVSVIHKKDMQELISGLSFTAHDGDKIAVIGEEGNGKSTLLKWIYSPELVEPYAEVQGERIIETGERCGYLPQSLSQEDGAMTVYDFFSSSDSFCDMSYDDMRKRTEQIGVPSDVFYSEQRMNTLSGGERIKIQMLRILMEQPTVLLLDEPSNDIDIDTLVWLEELILRWDGIVLFISHDEVLLERTANGVIHLERLRRKTESRCGFYRMSYGDYREQRSQKFQKQEQQAMQDRREKRERDEKLRRIEQSVAYAQATISRGDPSGGRLLKKKMHAVKSMERRFRREDEAMTTMPTAEQPINLRLNPAVSTVPAGKMVVELELERLMTEDGGRILSENISLSLRGSRKICITGANGVGKSTLLKGINNRLIGRKDIQAGYMPQNYDEELDPSKTAVELLDETGELEIRKKIRNFLGALRYTADEMDRPVAELSGGQKAKLMLMKLMLSGNNVLILDEPTRNISPMSGYVIRKLLREFPGAIISVSHDRKYIEEVCDTVYELTEEGLAWEVERLSQRAQTVARVR